MKKYFFFLLVLTFLFIEGLYSQPSAPILFSPPNGSAVVNVVILKWYRSAGATNYRVQLSLDSTFSTTIYSDSTLTDTTKTIYTGLVSMTPIFWRVNAR